MTKVFLIIGFLFSLVHTNGAEKTLKRVDVIYRHGARSPLGYYTTDPYQEKFWPDGSGRLTQYGMRLEYQLGKFLKDRYIKHASLVKEQYHHKEVYIQSSDVDRSIQSAQAQLAGLYPPKGYQVWNPQIPWQPIPIHTVPEKDDVFIRPIDVPCPRLQQVWKEKRKSEEYKKKLVETKPLLDTISKHSGMSINFDNLHLVTDSVRCEKAEGLKIPKWIDKIWEEAAALEDWLFVFHYSGDDEIGRLLGGSLLGKINENMDKFSKNESVSGLYKLNIWSGHDITILSFCAALGLKCHLPEYSASLMVELYHSVDTGYSVELQYRTNYTNTVERLKIKGCDYSCPLDKFLKLSKPRTTMDRSKLCGAALAEIKAKTLTFLVVGCTLLCAVIFIVYFLVKRHSTLFGYKLGYNTGVVDHMDVLIKDVEGNRE